MYDEATLWIYPMAACNLDDPPAMPSIPQQFHLSIGAFIRDGSIPTRILHPGSKQ